MKWLPWLICAVLALAMYHEGCKTADVQVVSDTVVTYDTIERITQTRPRLVYTYRTDTLTKYDTAYIIQDYSTSKVYRDSIVTDTLAVYIQDTISRNTIQGRSVAYMLLLPTRTITNTITERRNVSGLYIAPYAGVSARSVQSIGIGAVYVAPKWLGSVGYGTNGVQVGVGLRILPRR